MSQIHSVAMPVRKASASRSGISVSSSDSTSWGLSMGAPSSVSISPSMRIAGRAPDERYRTEAPRAAACRNTRSRFEIVWSARGGGGGTSFRIGFRVSGRTGAGSCAGAGVVVATPIGTTGAGRRIGTTGGGGSAAGVTMVGSAGLTGGGKTITGGSGAGRGAAASGGGAGSG